MIKLIFNYIENKKNLNYLFNFIYITFYISLNKISKFSINIIISDKQYF